MEQKPEKDPVTIDCNTTFGFLPERGLGLPPAGLVELLARSGIGRALTLSATGIYHNFETGNAETLAACSEHPQLIPVATVDPKSLVASGDEVAEYAKQGFAALRLYPRLQGWGPDLLPFIEIAKRADEAGLPMIVGLSEVGEATQLARVAADVSVPVTVSCDGIDLLGEVLAAADGLPNLCVETSGLLGLSAISLAVGRIGADRLVFGSNSPVYCPICETENVISSGLAKADQEKVLGKNASRVFGLEAESS